MTDKKERRKFDKALLDECIARDGATLIGEYTDEVLRYQTLIKFKCKCNYECEKKFYIICDYGGAICSIKCKAKEKPYVIYDSSLLNELLVKYDAKLVGEYQNLNMDTKISFICSCGKANTKGFRCMYKYCGPKCKECSKKIQVIKAKETFIDNYGVDNPNKAENIREKTKTTNLTKYGTEHTFQNEKVKGKIKETNKIKYGVEVPTQNKLIYDKIKKTNLERYGNECSAQSPEIKDKIKKTNLKKYGVENTFKSEEVRKKYKKTMKERYGVEHNFQAGELREKRKETFLKKYGVEYPSQNIEVMEKAQKNAKKYKEYKMPSGDIRKVQGYEPFALDKLIKIYTEEQIKTDRKDVPRIEYKVDDIKKYYFPDIFIPHENKLIEVKSTWTYKCKTDNIQLKANACKEQGYLYEIWCFDAKGNRIVV